jgi:hypothetical protein
MVQQLIERQELSESDPLIEPLIIFPEGTTSNGDYMIQFQKGAFVGLKSIYPKVIKYHCPFQNMSQSCIEGLPLWLISNTIFGGSA